MVEILNGKIHNFVTDLPDIWYDLGIESYYLFESFIYKVEIKNYIFWEKSLSYNCIR